MKIVSLPLSVSENLLKLMKKAKFNNRNDEFEMERITLMLQMEIEHTKKIQ